MVVQGSLSSSPEAVSVGHRNVTWVIIFLWTEKELAHSKTCQKLQLWSHFEHFTLTTSTPWDPTNNKGVLFSPKNVKLPHNAYKSTTHSQTWRQTDLKTHGDPSSPGGKGESGKRGIVIWLADYFYHLFHCLWPILSHNSNTCSELTHEQTPPREPRFETGVD